MVCTGTSFLQGAPSISLVSVPLLPPHSLGLDIPSEHVQDLDLVDIDVPQVADDPEYGDQLLIIHV